MFKLVYPCENCGVNEAVDRWCIDCLIIGNPLEKIPLGVGDDPVDDGDYDIPVRLERRVDVYDV